MRFAAIDLQRYGHFSDERLHFPQRECDFHLILGRNEAGKSTLRQAFHDLLFGIPMTTPMSFLHPGPELELGAVLAGPAGEFAFSRRRKRNGGLVDANGEPLPPDALHHWLGEVNEAFYERMFGLDHRRLEQGGRAMLQAGDNVDSVLFQAAAGVSALNGVLDGLRQEAASLWAPRRSRDRAWYAAADRLADADTSLKAAIVRPSAWADARRENRRLEEAYTQAESQHVSLLAQVRELERLRRSAPLMAQIRQYEAALAESGRGESRHGESDDGESRCTEGGDGTAAQQTGAAPALLLHEAEILRLGELRTRVAEHRVEIGSCTARIQLLWDRLAQALRRLGQPVPAADAVHLDTLVDKLPARPLRREIEHLLQEGRELSAQRDAAAQALEERRAEAERLAAEINGLPAVSLSLDLRSALNAATSAGDIVHLREAARHRAEQERATLMRRLLALTQPDIVPPSDPSEAVEWLARMEAWQAGTLGEQIQRRQRLQAEIDTLDKRLREATLETRAAHVELEQFRRSHQAVSRDEVMAARRERDTLWKTLSTAGRFDDTQADRYLILTQHADNLADLHLQAVGDAARLQALQHDSERQESMLEGLGESLAQAQGFFRQHEAEWVQACLQRRLPALPPADLQGWLASREAALQASERLASAESETSSLAARHDRLVKGLVAALADEGRTPPEDSSLESVCESARAWLHQAEQAQARREAMVEQLTRIGLLLPALQSERERCEARHAEWRGRRHDVLGRAGLPADAEPAYVHEALALLADADELAGELRDCQEQRTQMAAEVERYGSAAAGLARQLHDREFLPDAVDTHVRRWKSELDAARMAQRAREEANARLADLNERLLLEGEGRSRLEIEAELAVIDISTLAIRADALAAELEQAAGARSRLAVECEQARQALEAISGGDAAAQAEARRQEALADMGEIAERYIQLHAQYRLLEGVMERYRERRQGPLLARAGTLFSALTLGAHAGLVVDSEEASLHARRTDGKLVPLDGLSDGTRDQLYLALRLAALELYLDSAPPLPFIADDLFVNYDDRRAVAGLRQLASVAARTQVVFLTHHAHMVDLAHEAMDGAVHVIEL